jgi:3-oxoacyl-[acyl-carrier-protein] synthase II
MEAVKDAGLDAWAGDKERVGVCIGSGIGGLPMIEHTNDAYREGGVRKISPFFVPGSIINMVAGLASIHYGFHGPNLAIVSACSTANHSLGEAARLIEYGDADVMLRGTESTVSPLGIGGFCAARLHATTIRRRHPVRDRGRDGFVLGEGAGVWCWRSPSMQKRGRPDLL